MMLSGGIRLSLKKTYQRNIFENPCGYYEIHVELSIFDVIYQTKAFSILEMIVLTKSPNSEFPRGYFQIPCGFYKIHPELQNFNVTCQKKAFPISEMTIDTKINNSILPVTFCEMDFIPKMINISQLSPVYAFF